MKLLVLTGADAKPFRLLAQAFYAPFIDPATGVSSMRLGVAPERMAAALDLARGLSGARREGVEPPALREGVVELVLEVTPWALLEEHWRVYKSFLPPVLAEDSAAVDALLTRAETVTPEQYAARKKAL